MPSAGETSPGENNPRKLSMEIHCLLVILTLLLAALTCEGIIGHILK